MIVCESDLQLPIQSLPIITELTSCSGRRDVLYIVRLTSVNLQEKHLKNRYFN